MFGVVTEEEINKNIGIGEKELKNYDIIKAILENSTK